MNWLSRYDAHRMSDFKHTELSERDEQEFRKWFKETKLYDNVKGYVAEDLGVKKEDLSDDKAIDIIADPNVSDYDYRGAFVGGIKEEISPHDGNPHWSSRDRSGRMLKNPIHPTAWKEFFYQQHRQDPDSLGLHTFDQAKGYSPTSSIAKDYYGKYKDSINKSNFLK